MTPPEFDRSFGIIDPEQMEIVESEYGKSNGYYSESVDCEWVKKGENNESNR